MTTTPMHKGDGTLASGLSAAEKLEIQGQTGTDQTTATLHAYMGRVDVVLAAVRTEMLRALTKHPPTEPGWNPHCGYAVIREELEKELWEHVCADTGRTPDAGKEAIQVAAMGVRYVVECVGVGHLV